MRMIAMGVLVLGVFVCGAYAQRAANAIKSSRVSTTTMVIGCNDEREPVVTRLSDTATAIVVTCKQR